VRGGSEGVVRLLPGREKSSRQGHPWIFSGAVASVAGDPAAGDVVRVEDAGAAFLGRGFYSPQARIRVRILESREDAAVDEGWWCSRLREAIARRGELLADPAGACRLVFSEADRLPGLVVDRYARHLALQVHTPGAERMRAATLALLRELLAPAAILDRSEPGHRALEGLEPAPPAGAEAAPAAVEVLGALPPVATITGYHITPFVGIIPYPYDFHPSPREVKRLLDLPVDEFYPPERWRSGPYVFQGRTTRVCYWQNGQEVVWGATARILLNLLAHLGVHPIPGDRDATCLD